MIIKLAIMWNSAVLKTSGEGNKGSGKEEEREQEELEEIL